MKNQTTQNQDLFKELFAVGAHFGYSRSRNHPSVKRFIYGYKNHQAVIDLAQTVRQLERAESFLRDLAAEGKEVLWVGNKAEAREVIKRGAEALGLPYVASRWLGGTFTNWPQIKSRIERLKDLKTKKEKGELSVYTKKERLLFDKEIVRLERYLASLSGMDKLPAAVVIVDPRQEEIVVREANRARVPVVALAGSDCDLAGLDYPVIGNDSNIQSIKFFIDRLAEAYRAGQKLALAKAVAVPTEATLAATPVVQSSSF